MERDAVRLALSRSFAVPINQQVAKTSGNCPRPLIREHAVRKRAVVVPLNDRRLVNRIMRDYFLLFVSISVGLDAVAALDDDRDEVAHCRKPVGTHEEGRCDLMSVEDGENRVGPPVEWSIVEGECNRPWNWLGAEAGFDCCCGDCRRRG